MLVTLFCDASLCANERVGGWAAWLKSGREPAAHVMGAAFRIRVGDTTMAESMAVVNAVATGLREGHVRDGDDVLLQTDNDSVMSVLDGSARRSMGRAARQRQGLSRRAAKAVVRERNAEIAEVSAIFAAMVERHRLGIRWRHVKGHRGNADRRSAVNSICDRTARAHMRAARGSAPPTLAEARAAAAAERSVTVVVDADDGGTGT